MLNLYKKIQSEPRHYRQLNCGDALITIFTCDLTDKYVNLWSDRNYIVYVVEGRKIWHSAQLSYDLRQGDCVFIRKGAHIVEQFFDSKFCLILFFIPDEFIYDVLKAKSTPIYKVGKKYEPIITIRNTAAVQAFFQSMMPHFDASKEPDQSLLELKFKELILTIADNPLNNELLAYFYSLLKEPQCISLQRVMEDNFCFNLKMEEFAKLSARSLSAFKRDFRRLYNTSPGKWLMEKRLNHTIHLLTNMGKTVSETAFESGFESPSHFSRAFRQRFGVSPIMVRQQAAV